MSKNFKWNKLGREKSGSDLRVVLFTSRNKDNSHLDGFKERKKSFLAYLDGYNVPDWLDREFQTFVAQGQFSELCRMYISVNARDQVKVKKNLTIKLIENPEGIDLSKIEPIVAGTAARVENRAAAAWLFDWDSQDDAQLNMFCDDIREMTRMNPVIYNTPHGRAVIVDHGFDNRELVKEWGDVAIPKKDDLLCVRWQYNYSGMISPVMECVGVGNG